MKYTVALSAMAAVAAAKPLFLNTAFVVEEGKPFQIKMSGCDTGCTLEIDNGDPSDWKNYKTLSTSATGNEITVTLSDIPSDTYTFRLTDNATGEYNFSEAFEYEGTGPVSTSASASASSTTVSSTTSASTSSTTSATSSSSTLITTTASNTTTVASTTTSASRTSSVQTTTSATTSPTDVPGAAGRLASPLALVAGAVVAMLIFN